ncbi:MAG TPA: glycosyltransferase [Thermoanaerobaculia bacterium]|nr:glycosyltransferase [Thermoanaerobaculia bacterium]
MTADLSAIIVNFRSAGKAAACAATLREGFEREGIAGEIVLVDCGSGAGERAELARVSADVRVLLPENRGYSGGLNAGLARANGRCLLLSNADVEYRPGALTALLEAASEKRTGAAAPRLEWDAAGRLLLPPGFDPGFLTEIALRRGTGSGARDARRFAAFARDSVRLWTAGGAARHLAGTVLASRRDVFDRAGRFDERFPFEYEETEWEDRVRRCGLELRAVPAARVRHLWGSSAVPDPETTRRREVSRRVFREDRYGTVGRRILERAERRGVQKPLPPLPRLEEPELPARAGTWVGISPHASGFPFAGTHLSTPFRLPDEVRAAMPRGPWFWTVFSSDNGHPFERYTREEA